MSRQTSVGNDAFLRQHGLQVTVQRLAVLRAVFDRAHSTADDIYQVVRGEIGAMSRQAVYDPHAALTERGPLRRVQPARSPTRYENRVGNNHHHLICRTSGPMVDVEVCGRRHALPDGCRRLGLRGRGAEVIYWGRCPVCVAAT